MSDTLKIKDYLHLETIWKPIPGFPYYEASNLGDIRSLDKIVQHRKVGEGGLKHWNIKEGWYDDIDLKYHSSWDWLLPAWHKFVNKEQSAE